MRCPSSLLNGLKAMPGSSLPSFAHFTIRAIADAPSQGPPSPTTATVPRRCYSSPSVTNGFDTELLALINHPGTRWLDLVMSGASSRRNLLLLLVLVAVYLWRRSPHGLLAVVLLGLSVGAADLVSVRLVKPHVARIRPCKA